MKVITVASLKGGVGKTSIVSNLGLAFSKKGFRTLLIDLDPNNNLSDYLLRFSNFKKIWEANVYHVLAEKKNVQNCIYRGLFADILPSTLELQKVTTELFSDPGCLLRFRTTLRRLHYDFIIIDTPPNLSFEFRTGIFSADEILTPLAPVRWNLQALTILNEEIVKIQKTLGKMPALRGVPSMVTVSQMDELRGTDLAVLTRTGILKANEIYTAQKKGTVLKETSKSWIRFAELAKEVA
jgi:chromosome partitioning protein